MQSPISCASETPLNLNSSHDASCRDADEQANPYPGSAASPSTVPQNAREGLLAGGTRGAGAARRGVPGTSATWSRGSRKGDLIHEKNIKSNKQSFPLSYLISERLWGQLHVTPLTPSAFSFPLLSPSPPATSLRNSCFPRRHPRRLPFSEMTSKSPGSSRMDPTCFQSAPPYHHLSLHLQLWQRWLCPGGMLHRNYSALAPDFPTFSPHPQATELKNHIGSGGR